MRKLEDKLTGLVWLIPEEEIDLNKKTNYYNPVYIPEDAKTLKEFSKELNQYHSENITKFVTGNCNNLGDFILWSAFDTRFPCYCFDNGKLVATAVICPNNIISKKKEVRAYINYCKNNPSLNDMPGYISYKKAQQILDNSTKTNNADIDYFVVVPPEQNKGIGTRAVYSITHNMDFFAPEKQVNTIYTQIHKANKASQAIFNKENFKKYNLGNILSTYPLEDYIKCL